MGRFERTDARCSKALGACGLALPSPGAPRTGRMRSGAGVTVSKGGVSQRAWRRGAKVRGECCTLGRMRYLAATFLAIREGDVSEDVSSECRNVSDTLRRASQSV